MQETITTTPDDELPPSRPRRFRLIALGLVLTMFVPFAYIAYRNIADAVSDPGPNPNPGFPEPDFSLTDERAIQTFQPLLHHTHLAVEHRDLSILPQVFTSDSPMKARTMKIIGQLKKDDVIDSSEFETLSLEVVSNEGNQIQLSEQVLTHPCFMSEEGDDLTQGPEAFEYETLWTMRLENSRWLIHDSNAKGDEVVNDQEATC